MNVQTQIGIFKIVQNEEKWLINVSEDMGMKNATLDTIRSLNQVLICCEFVPCVFS